MDPTITITSVPYVTFHSDPEWRFSAISAPFIPPTSGPRAASNVNVVSAFGIIISGDYKEDRKDFLVTIDATKAIQPENHRFNIDQVIDAATTCVKMMYPQRPVEEGSLEIMVKRPKQKQK